MSDTFTFLGQPASGVWDAPDQGYLAWTVDPALINGSSAATVAGRLEFSKIELPVAARVTNLVMSLQVALGTPTAGQNFAGLYTAAGVLVAQTADQSTVWSSAGVKAMALAGGPYNLQAGVYYGAWWYNATTGPSWLRAATAAQVNINTAAPNLRVGSADTGLTATAPASMGAQTGQTAPWWMALS